MEISLPKKKKTLVLIFVKGTTKEEFIKAISIKSELIKRAVIATESRPDSSDASGVLAKISLGLLHNKSPKIKHSERKRTRPAICNENYQPALKETKQSQEVVGESTMAISGLQ